MLTVKQPPTIVCIPNTGCNFSQGSVAKLLMCGGVFNSRFITNLAYWRVCQWITFENIWWSSEVWVYCLDEELISYRYSSCSCCSCCLATFSKAPSFQIGSGWNLAGMHLLQVNTHRLTESNVDCRLDVTLSQWRPLRHFTQKKCCHLLEENEVSPCAYRFYSNVRQYLISYLY